MPRPSKQVSLGIHEAAQLVAYFWAALNHPEFVGNCGPEPYEDICRKIDEKSEIVFPREVFDNLIYHYKQMVMERQRLISRKTMSVENYNKFFETLAARAPNMFKKTEAGEWVIVDYSESETDA